MIDESEVRESETRWFDQSRFLTTAENAPPGDAVESIALELLTAVGATQVVFSIADLSGHRLVPISRVTTSSNAAGAEAVSVEDSHEGIALRRQKTQIINNDGVISVYAPVTSRGDTMGVLAMVLPHPPTSEILSRINAASHALAYVLIANRRHTDLYEWGQRSAPMTLAAEIQRRLIPGALTCEAGWFTVAGWLEPSADVAGDTFDYSFDKDQLTLSLTDAMGHSVDSALLATVGIAALRNERRAGGGIDTQAAAANAALSSHSTGDQYVTGVLVDIPLDGSQATLINAGHPHPFLLRNGSASVLRLHANAPFGMFSDTQYELQSLDLRLGDRLILVTDGLLERNVSDFDIRASIEQLGHLHPREFVRSLCGKITEAAGEMLADDATILCFDWHHEPGTLRHSDSGADPPKTSG